MVSPTSLSWQIGQVGKADKWMRSAKSVEISVNLLALVFCHKLKLNATHR